MYYLVSADHKGMAAYLTRSDCEVLYIKCNRWDWWWHVVEWLWYSLL